MQGRCESHMFDVAIDVCGQCLGEYCGDCVVYPFGPTALPLCMSCAVAASGVRAGSAPRRTGRTQRREALRRRADLGRARIEPSAAWPPPAT
jgi:hypothetical protein